MSRTSTRVLARYRYCPRTATPRTSHALCERRSRASVCRRRARGGGGDGQQRAEARRAPRPRARGLAIRGAQAGGGVQHEIQEPCELRIDSMA